MWIPKYRRKALYGEPRNHLGPVLSELARQHECVVEEGHLNLDHVHMLLSMPRSTRNICAIAPPSGGGGFANRFERFTSFKPPLVVVLTCLRPTIGPVYNIQVITGEPHYRARGDIVPLLDPETGTTREFPETPIRFSDRSGRVRFPDLPMGAANQVILQDLLGYTPEELTALQASGAI